MEDVKFKSSASVEKLLKSKGITEPTRRALQGRILQATASRRFFTEHQFDLLSIVCDRLMDQDPGKRILNVAIFIDERLADNNCDGWRYDNMPTDDVMFALGLEGIDQAANMLFHNNFILLHENEQLETLQRIQQATAPGEAWKSLDAKRFFEELLAETTEIFYSHPEVQLMIGYYGMMDAEGWKEIGLRFGNGYAPLNKTGGVK